MNGSRASTALAILTALVAACGGVAPGASPSPASSQIAIASPTPKPTYRLMPTFVTTPGPTENPWDVCPTVDPAEHPEAEILGGDGSDSIQVAVTVTSMARKDRPDELIHPDPPDTSNNEAYLVGGRRTHLSAMDYSFGPYGLSSIRSMQAILRLDGREPMPLTVTYETGDGRTGAVIHAPDIAGRGTLDFSLEWEDRCFYLEGHASTPVRIELAATVAACPEDHDAGLDELAATFEPPIRVGSVDADLVPWGWSGKVANLSVIDPLPPYVAFDADTPTFTVGPGATVTVSGEQPNMTLFKEPGLQATFFRRAALIRWLEGGWIHGDQPEAEVVFRSAITALPNGDFTFVAPPDVARYAVQLGFGYEATCHYGSAGTVVGLDVAAT